jgi:hypothetical protein
VPFIFLSALDRNDEIVHLLDAGADDFVSKPFHLARLVAKVRATLRFSDRRKDALTGPVGKGGPLPLLKFCEDSRLTGRLTIERDGQRHWVEFLGGEMVQVGGPGDEGAGSLEEDRLGALLALDSGAYRIEQKKLDRSALSATQDRGPASPEMAAAPATSAPATLPGGRLSMVEARGRQLQVQTECENRPHFTVTTVIVRSGQVVRKVESSWQHPLQRATDMEMARAQVDRQHDRVVATLRTLADVREAVAPRAAEPVDAALLGWAVSFVGEQVRDHLGAVMTVALLRREHRALVPAHPALRALRVADDGRVVLSGDAAAGGSLVKASAAWTNAFLAAAGEISERVRLLKVRQVTRMMEAELEKVGFYRAVEG